MPLFISSERIVLHINSIKFMRILTILFAILCHLNAGFSQTYTKFTGTNSVVSFTPTGTTRYQLIYSPANFNTLPPTCVIGEVSFKRNGGPSNVQINNLKIKLGSVDETDFNQNQFFQNLTTVLDRPVYNVAESGVSSIVDFDVDDLFTYQQGKTLVVEISYTSASANLNMVYTNRLNRLNGNLASQTGSSSLNWLDFGFTPKLNDLTPPPNDLCTNARFLSLNVDCQPQTGNSVGANQSLPPAFCGGFPSSAAEDVYYKFTASTASDSILVSGLGGFDPVVQLLSGSCGSLSPVSCSYTPGNLMPEKIAPGNLVPGQTYFIRVYGFNGVGGSFTICGRSGSPAVPENDNCANAISLTLNPVCAAIPGTTAGATQELAPIPCFGNTSSSAKEVWYKFQAVNAFDSIIVTSDGFINPVLELYSGTCGNQNTISCSDNPGNPLAREKVFTGNLVPGNTYFLRVYGFGTSSGSFSVCGKTPPANPPANDEACEAISLVINDECQALTFNNNGATQTFSPIICQPGGQSSAAADVWFKFDYSSPFDTIIVSPVGNFNPVVEMYTSFLSCLGINSDKCSDGANPGDVEKIAVSGQSANMIYVRVYGFNGTTGQFNICVRRADPSVMYDICANALNIEVSNTTCTPRRGRTTLATPTTGLAACKGNPDDDVWYRFDPFGAMNLVFRLSCDPGFDGAFQIFSGACGSLTPLACVNRMGDGKQEDTLLNFTNNTLVYYIRVYHAGAGPGTGGFSLCINRINAPANDNCSGAVLLQGGANLCSPVAASNYAAAQANAPLNCGNRTSAAANDVWFWFSATSSTMEINVQPVGGMDPVIQLYTGGCFSLLDRACKDDSTAGQGERLIATNLLVGSSYYFRVYSFRQATAFGDFTVCVKNSNICNTTSGTASTNIPAVTSNGRIILNLSGQSNGASVQWQVSTNGGNSYNNIGAANPVLPDTFNVNTTTTQNHLYRAVVTATGCLPANSQPVTVSVRCATPFTNPISASSGTYISNFSLHTLNQNSTPQWQNGGYENFTNTSVALCKGQSYPLSISHQPGNELRIRTVWADFNNDGDYGDANELLIPPNPGTGTLSQQITIPATALSGSIRLRVMVIDPGVSSPSGSPCFVGPYAAGEIEEYTLNLSAPVVANAGIDRIVCVSSVGVQGSNPAPGTGLWSVVSGSATLQNATNALVSVSNIGLLPSMLEWRVTNGACVSRDSMRISREAIPNLLPDDTTGCVGRPLIIPSPTGFQSILWFNGNAGPSQQFTTSGSYWVMVTTQNGCTFRDTMVVTFEVCTKVDAEFVRNEIKPMPNPVSDYLTIAGLSAPTRILIWNAEGKLLSTQTSLGEVRVSELPSGLYFLQIPEKELRFKILKK